MPHTVKVGACVFCGLRVVIDHAGRSAEHEVPVCNEFREAVLAIGAQDEGTSELVPADDQEETEPDAERPLRVN